MIKMIHYLLIILLFFPFFASAQSAKILDNTDAIYQFIKKIDKTIYTDTVIINDTLTDLKSKKEKEIVGYFKGDTLLKTVSRFKNETKARTSYYWDKEVIYVREYEPKKEKLLTEIYVYDGKVLRKHLEEASIEKGMTSALDILRKSDYSIDIEFKKVDRKASKYEFIGILTDIVALPPDCGFIASAVVHKFEVLDTDFPDYRYTYVLIIEACPEFLGENFFQKGKKYKIRASTNSGVTFDYMIDNIYKKEDTPTFWSQEIKMIK